MREDLYSRDVEGAAGFARYHDPAPVVDRPSLRELDRDENDTSVRSPYEGVCGGCDGRVSANVHNEMDRKREGACWWKSGPWHPSCRNKDRAADRQAVAA